MTTPIFEFRYGKLGGCGIIGELQEMGWGGKKETCLEKVAFGERWDIEVGHFQSRSKWKTPFGKLNINKRKTPENGRVEIETERENVLNSEEFIYSNSE